MELSVDKLTLHLPHYLSAPRQEGIKSALVNFPHIAFFYLNAYSTEVLQGDVWAGLTAIDFESCTKKRILGVVISNSCDIDPENESKIGRAHV